MRKYSVEDIESWPQDHKKCLVCLEVLSVKKFSKNKKCLFGLSNKCRDCSGVNQGFTRFTAEEEEGWPEHYRGCVECRVVKPFSEFHAHAGCRWGVNTVCKSCRRPKSVERYALKREDFRQTLWESARSRAGASGADFSISLEDIAIPAECPVFGTPFVKGTPFAPSLDRIDPTLGYVPGNIMVISRKANTMKNNATREEILAFSKFYERLFTS